jgi:hypothetical protein
LKDGYVSDELDAKLNYAKHDGADEGEGDIGRKNAQLADERHGKAPLGSRRCPHNNSG